MRPLGRLSLAIFLCGCGGGEVHAIIVSAYSQTCSKDSDCVPVYQGTLGCCGPGCANAAINQSSYVDYLSDVSAREPACYGEDPCALLDDVVCKASAACRGGVCEFVAATADAAANN
jgi:hypothetical protein